jgi:hypothetical protein
LDELNQLKSQPEVADISTELFNRYVDESNDISTFNPDKFYPGNDLKPVRAYFGVIYNTGVAYAFDLNMAETNNLGAATDLLGPWAPKFTMGISGNLNRQRANDRTFTVTDTIGKMLEGKTINKNYCNGRLVGENYAYPITGKIGVYQVIRAFLDIAIFDNLQMQGPAVGAGKKAASGKAAPPADAAAASKVQASTNALVDQLTFTTTIDTTVSPKVVFAPAGHELQAADASVTPVFSRTDTHKVQIGVALAPASLASLGSLNAFAFGPLYKRSPAGTPTIAFTTLMATYTDEAEALAAKAVDQRRSQNIYLIPSQ